MLFEYHLRHELLDDAFDRSAHRSCTALCIVAPRLDQELDHRVRAFEGDAALAFEPRARRSEHATCDPADLILIERRENDDLVDAVPDFRAEVLLGFASREFFVFGGVGLARKTHGP